MYPPTEEVFAQIVACRLAVAGFWYEFRAKTE